MTHDTIVALAVLAVVGQVLVAPIGRCSRPTPV